MDAATYRVLLARARRLARSTEEARDLVQETLLAGVLAGRSEPAWLAGVLRNQAAMLARASGRRRLREARAAQDAELVHPAPRAPADGAVAGQVLERLPPAARRVAALALHGLGPQEIRWILGLTPAAFRQRLTSIRRALADLPPSLRAESAALGSTDDPEDVRSLPFGLLRRALKAALQGGGLGTHDPDGHLLVVRPAHRMRAGGN